MLWKKESNKSNALYANIMALSSRNLKFMYDCVVATDLNSKPIPQKSDAIALDKRNKGNYAFRVTGLAMELYNESLCYAIPGSENVSLAYANRATCFLQMKMYDQCLKDIELAKEAGYPEHLMPKLERRKETCLEQMREDAQPSFTEAKLSFDPDEDFPCIANVLKVEKDFSGDFRVVAKDDIDVDQTIVVENSYLIQLSKRFGLKCNICLKGYANLVPCKKCAVAMFCEGCQNHFLHEYECGVNMCGPGAFNSDVLLAMRGVLLAINAFPDIDALMNFVEDIIRTDAGKMPETLVDDQSKYRAFFVRAKPDYPSIDDLVLPVYPVYKTILSIPKIKAMFQSKKHLRFLQHLIAHHSSIAPSRAHFGSAKDQSVSEEYANPMSFSAQVDLMDGYFKHSCGPNVLAIGGDGKSVHVTVRPIKRGEQLFISTIPISIEPTKYRQEYILKRSGLMCECARCKGITATPEQRQQMVADPIYRRVLNPLVLVLTLSQYDNLNQPIEHCVNFLRKYGRMDWCDELKAVLETYQSLLFVRVAGVAHPNFTEGGKIVKIHF